MKKILWNNLKSKYLVDDEFLDTLGVGFINGTFSFPGPGIRKVVDTGNRLTISNGKLLSSGGGSSGDPAIWFNNCDHALGRVLLAEVTKVLNSTITDIGWDSNQTGGLYHGIRFAFAAGFLGTLESGAGGPNIGTFVTGTSYKIGVIDRGQGLGFWGFIKGGIYTTWSLIWTSNTSGSVVGMYPSINHRGADTSEFLKVPKQLYVPTLLTYDTFSRSDGVLGNSENVGPDRQSISSLLWVDKNGVWGIVNGVAQASSLSGGLAISTVSTNSVDVHIKIALTRSGGKVGGVARYQDANNYLRFSHDGTNVLCEKVVTGSASTLKTGVFAYSPGAYIYLILAGTIGRLYYNNGSLVGGSSFVVPASTYTDHGLYTTDVGNIMDNFEVWPYGTAGEHSILDTM